MYFLEFFYQNKNSNRSSSILLYNYIGAIIKLDSWKTNAQFVEDQSNPGEMKRVDIPYAKSTGNVIRGLGRLK
jgi:hypothetical protein